MRASIDRRQIVDHARLQFGADIGGGGELALGQAVHAVVFDDVDHGQIAPHEVDELSHADGSSIAVAADAERHQIAVGEHSARGHRSHAAMHRIEAVRAAHEVRRALGGAADAAELDHALRLDAHFVHGVDDALGNGVVAATRAERGLASAVIDNGEADAVGLRRRRGGWCGRHLLALHGHEFVGYRARVQWQPVDVGDAAQARHK